MTHFYAVGVWLLFTVTENAGVWLQLKYWSSIGRFICWCWKIHLSTQRQTNINFCLLFILNTFIADKTKVVNRRTSCECTIFWTKNPINHSQKYVLFTDVRQHQSFTRLGLYIYLHRVYKLSWYNDLLKPWPGKYENE